MIWSEFLTDRPLSEEEIRTACAALLAAVGIGAGLSFLAALLIAGVVLAVGFVILEIRSRWAEYAAQHGTPNFWTALQIVGVSLLSLSGIPQVIEALRGARLVSDAPLTATERWVLGLGGLVQVVVFLLGVRAGLRSLGRRGTAAGRVQTAPGPGAGGYGAASEFGDMTGMSRTAVDAFLRARGANVSRTAGGYTRYRFPDKSEVWIRPDGEVVRLPAPQYAPDGRRINKGARLDQRGRPTTMHNTGERVIDR